jgi:hypothetical protein
MTDINIVTEELIQSKIMMIRGKKVILDKDIALLYEVDPRALRQQVKRNLERFPDDFMFTLTEKETTAMVSQFVTPSKKYFGGSLPYVFTEQGIAMLSSVLTSSRAVHVNIQIMRTFSKLREIMSTHSELRRKIEDMEEKYDYNFKVVFDTIKKLIDPPIEPKGKIGF